MGWKKWPYWLKGAYCTTILFLIFTILLFSFDHTAGTILDWVIIVPLLPFAFGGLFLGGAKEIIVGFGIQYILYFGVGSLLGWIYAKIKKEKSN